MFEYMEIEDSIYEGVLESSYKITTRINANCDSISSNTIGESASSNTYSEMSKSAKKHIKSYVDHLEDRLTLNFLIHVPGHSSDECKVLGGFGSKYSKIRLTKDHGQEPATNKKFNINPEKNAIVHHSVHQIILQDKTT